MIDIWLIFNLIVPFLEVLNIILQTYLTRNLFQVLLQTFIEHLRGKVEEKKEINHHGKTIEIGETKVEESPKIINVKGSVRTFFKIFYCL